MKEQQTKTLTPKLRFPEFKDGPGWNERALKDVCEVNPEIQAVRKPPEVLARRPDQIAQCRDGELPQLTDRADALAIKDLACDLTDSPEATDRQRIEKRLDRTRLYD